MIGSPNAHLSEIPSAGTATAQSSHKAGALSPYHYHSQIDGHGALQVAMNILKDQIQKLRARLIPDIIA